MNIQVNRKLVGQLIIDDTTARLEQPILDLYNAASGEGKGAVQARADLAAEIGKAIANGVYAAFDNLHVVTN